MLHGVAQHLAHHAGQIALIRKLAETSPVGSSSGLWTAAKPPTSVEV